MMKDRIALALAAALVVTVALGAWLVLRGSHTTATGTSPHSTATVNASAAPMAPVGEAASLELLYRIQGDPSPVPRWPPVAPPQLEQQRAAEAGAQGAAVVVTTALPGVHAFEVEKVASNHFSIQTAVRGHNNWFMMKLDGVAGRTIRIDLKKARGSLENWGSLNPVFCYTDSADDPSIFETTEVANPAQDVIANNRTALPDTAGQHWKFISGTWWDRKGVSFVHKFEKSPVIVAMRYPFTVAYADHWLGSLQGARSVVETIGTSAKGRPLRVVRISDAAVPANHCVVIYAREHGNEQDTGFVVQGAVDFLLSDDPEAADILRRLSFIVIPMVDPDDAAEGRFSSRLLSFVPSEQVPEAVTYANYFKRLIDSGRAVDLVVNLHNAESRESQHLFCVQVAPDPASMSQFVFFHNDLISKLTPRRIAVETRVRRKGASPARLGGWLELEYGALHVPYEVNCQAAVRHLTIADLRFMGAMLVDSVDTLLRSEDGARRQRAVEDHLRRRAERWQQYGNQIKTNNAIVAEYECRMRSGPDGVATAGSGP